MQPVFCAFIYPASLCQILAYFVSFRNKLGNCFHTNLFVLKEYLFCVWGFLYGYGLFSFINPKRPNCVLLFIIHLS